MLPTHCTGTLKRDMVVSLQPDRLTVRLNWFGRVLDGPLKKRVKSSEMCWSLDKTEVNVAALKAQTQKKAHLQAMPSQPTHQHKPRHAACAAAPSLTSSGKSSAVRQNVHTASVNGGVMLEEVCEMTELLLVVPKEEDGRFWRALFEGGEEKSHLEVCESITVLSEQIMAVYQKHWQLVRSQQQVACSPARDIQAHSLL